MCVHGRAFDHHKNSMFMLYKHVNDRGMCVFESKREKDLTLSELHAIFFSMMLSIMARHFSEARQPIFFLHYFNFLFFSLFRWNLNSACIHATIHIRYTLYIQATQNAIYNERKSSQ